jgi:hypothetical protein
MFRINKGESKKNRAKGTKRKRGIRTGPAEKRRKKRILL